MAIYFADLAEFEARDVDNACTWLRQNTGPFLPSIATIREQAATERDVRLENDSRPDFTGVSKLPEAERDRLHDEGLRASSGVAAPLLDATERDLRRMLTEREA